MRVPIRRVYTPVPINTADAAVALAWGLSSLDWRDLSNGERAHYRLHVAKAPFIGR